METYKLGIVGYVAGVAMLVLGFWAQRMNDGFLSANIMVAGGAAALGAGAAIWALGREIDKIRSRLAALEE